MPSDNERRTRVLRIKVEADDKYLNAGSDPEIGWGSIILGAAMYLTELEKRASMFGDVKITVASWEDEAR